MIGGHRAVGAGLGRDDLECRSWTRLQMAGDELVEVAALEGVFLEGEMQVRAQSANLPAPDIIAGDITADLEAALEQFATIAMFDPGAEERLLSWELPSARRLLAFGCASQGGGRCAAGCRYPAPSSIVREDRVGFIAHHSASPTVLRQPPASNAGAWIWAWVSGIFRTLPTAREGH